MASSEQSKSEKQRYQEFVSSEGRKPEGFQEVKREHTENLEKIRQKFSDQGLGDKVDFVGSSYNHTRTKAGGHEFDVDIVQRRSDLQAKPTKTPGEYILQGKPGVKTDTKNFQSGGLSSGSVATEARECIRDVIKETSGLNKAQVKSHGPASQLDVFRSSGELKYSADIVPSVEIEGTRYVPTKDGQKWRESHAVDEKQDMTREAKETLRGLKAMRNNDAPLQNASSHASTTAVLNLSKNQDWSNEHPAERAKQALGYIGERAKEGFMPSHRDPEVNALGGMSEEQLENLSGRAENLASRPKQLEKVMSRGQHEASN